ncbi:MAG: FkbM family methyltransferase [Cyanobacteria bacterium P01_E01_bin.42]
MHQLQFKIADVILETGYVIGKITKNTKRSIGLAKHPVLSEDCRLIKTEKIVNVAGVKMPIPQAFYGIPFSTLLWKSVYERGELKIIKAILQQSDRVMELGTGLGFLSTHCARIVGSDRIFTYEANPNLEPYIRQVYRLNQITPQVNFCMLGDKDGEQNFYISKWFWESSSIQIRKTYTPIQVPVKSFNEEVRKNNPSVLIVDIEGGEYDLVQYADFYNIEKVIMEIHRELIGVEKIKFIITQLRDREFKINEKLSNGRELYLEKITVENSQ